VRSWQLVGARDIGLTSTVAAVIHRSASESLRRAEGSQAGSADRMAPAKDVQAPEGSAAWAACSIFARWFSK
jgi:hypothetical protein